MVIPFCVWVTIVVTLWVWILNQIAVAPNIKQSVITIVFVVLTIYILVCFGIPIFAKVG
jgi:hypothetical protein